MAASLRGPVQLNGFERLLLRSSSQLEQADRLLTYLTTFLPGQTPSMELVSEALVSASAVLQMYKSQVLNKITADASKSLDSKYLDAVYKESSSYKTLAYCLSVIKSTELLVEMSSARYKGERGRWSAVLALETVKSTLRLTMLCLSQRALPSTIPVHDIEADPEEIMRLLAETESGVKSSNFDEKVKLSSPNMRSANILQVPDYDRLRPPKQLMRRLTPELAFAEVVGILRPVIYAGLLYRYRGNKRSWTPWLVGASLEFASRELTRLGLASSKKPSALEKMVSQERNRDMFWWLMRSRLYDEYTRNFLMRIVKMLMRWPVLNLGGHLLEDFLYLFDEYYFASATL